MGKLSPMEKACIFISWVVMLMCCTAEREYFPQLRTLPWDEARNHCQVCFKDLVTLTPENIQTITQNLTSDYWVGLRKNFSSTSMQNMSWTRWANGDPLTFQNWYPGRPVLKPPLPKSYCCSCSCTCPVRMTTTVFPASTIPNGTNSSEWTSTPASVTSAPMMTMITGSTNPNVTSAPTMTSLPPVEAECVRSPMLTPEVADPDEIYIDDACVAMLSFGAWVEKDCSEFLPYICYEDRFFGRANVTNVTLSSANLTWLPGPGDINYYRLEVNGDRELMENVTDLTYDLVNLTAGTLYSVQVFPVKCERDLNPQEVTFYTEPNKVTNFKYAKVTETSVLLNWNKPAGNVDFYLVEVQGLQCQSPGESCEVPNLIPGSPYSFTVLSEVKDKSIWGENSHITTYTRPGKVSNLTANNTENSLLPQCVRPEGNFTAFRVTAENGSNCFEVPNLIPGSPYMFTVLSGVKDKSIWSEKSHITTYTRPGKVSNLTANNTENSLLLQWVRPEGNFTGFRVMAVNNSNNLLLNTVVNQTKATVKGLTKGTQITISVTALANNTLEGDAVTIVSYTAPGPVSDLTLVTTHHSLNASWKPPENNYSSITVILKLNRRTMKTVSLTKHWENFDGLKVAAKYTVIVSAVYEGLEGPSVKRSKFTLPLPPTDVKAINTSKEHITFQWKAPVNSATVTYSVRINSSFWGYSAHDTVDNETNYTFSGLKSGTKYDFEVHTVAGGNSSLPAKKSHSTDADEREISLSMLCSSAEVLLCDENTTRASVFEQLHEHFNNLLGDNIFWKLEQLERKN